MLRQLIELETAIDYSFKDRSLLERALVHGSANLSPEELHESERLSWLGDAILQMIVSEALIESYRKAKIEELHTMRKRLPENATLGRIGSSLGIEEAARTGRSLERNLEIPDRHIMIAGILEGVLAAVYCDGGMDNARLVALRFLKEDLSDLAG